MGAPLQYYPLQNHQWPTEAPSLRGGGGGHRRQQCTLTHGVQEERGSTTKVKSVYYTGQAVTEPGPLLERAHVRLSVTIVPSQTSLPVWTNSSIYYYVSLDT